MFDKEKVKNPESKTTFKTEFKKEKKKYQRELFRNQILKRRLKTEEKTKEISNRISFKLNHLDSFQNENLKNKIIEYLLLEPKIENLEKDIESLNSEDIYIKHLSIINIRKLIIINQKICQKIIDNCLLKLFEFASDLSQPHLQLESNWILTNLCSLSSPHNIINLINKGIIDIFIETLKSKYSQIVEQAIWGIGNLSGDNINVKLKILKKNKIDFLIEVYLFFKNEIKIYNCFIWIFSNLCSFELKVNLFHLQKRLKIILIENFIISEDEHNLEESLLGVVYNFNDDLLDSICEINFLNKLKLYYNINLQNFNENRLKLIYEILLKISLSDKHEEILINHNFLHLLKIAMDIKNDFNIEKICLILNNLSFKYTNEIIKEQNLVQKILSFLNLNKKYSKDALWVICSMCSYKDKDCVNYLINIIQVIDIFKNILLNDKNENEIISIVLQAMIKLFLFFKEIDQLIFFRNEIIICGLAEIIEKYQTKSNNLIYVNSLFIMENFFEIGNFVKTF